MGATFTPTFSADSTFQTTTVTNNVSSEVIVLNGIIENTYTNPITATGEFLGIDVNGTRNYIKVWQS